MAPPADHSLHYSGDGDAALSLALLVVNVVVLSAAILLCCSFHKKKTADFTNERKSRRESNDSELKKVTGIEEIEVPEKNGTNNGVIPSGAVKLKKSKKNKIKDVDPKRNGSAAADDGQGSLDLKHRALPLPPPSFPPERDDDSLYDLLTDEEPARPPAHQTDPGPVENRLGETPGNNCVVNNGDVHNPDFLENVNPLYTPVLNQWKDNAPGSQESAFGVAGIGLGQGDEVSKEPISPISIADEPIYSVVRRDKSSVKIPNVSKGTEGPDRRITDTPADPPNLVVSVTSSFKVNTMLKKHKQRSFKSCVPQENVSMNIDFEGPPPVPDKLFDIESEAKSEEQRPNVDDTRWDIELED